MVGYSLMAIAIGLTSIILVYGAYGYGVDPKTGEVIQNSLLFVDSKPGGAEIILNGQTRQTTSARLTIPAGSYELTLKKAGYRDWSQKFTLNEHSIARYAYPLLLPVKPLTQHIKAYGNLPPLVSQSPDRRWLLVQAESTATLTRTFIVEQYDTTKLDQPPQTLTLPSELLSGAGPAGSLRAIEWASDNDHLLIQHTYQGGTEFLVLNRTNPSLSFNINRTFNINPSQVAMRDKRVNQFYIYKNDSTLDLGDVSKASLQPLLSYVLAFKSYGPDLLSYVTDQKVAAGKVMARIWENGKTYPLYTFSAGSQYLIDAAQFQGHWYYVAGSDTADRINIYKDPLSGIKDPATAKAIPLIALRDWGANNLSFSSNNRFVGVQAGQKFGVYDIETQTRYQYDLTVPLTSLARWMDGHHWIGNYGGNVLIMDFDSANQQVIVPTASAENIYFDKNYNQMLTFIPTEGGLALTRTDLRAGTDLPQ
ncbi:PEGA domain-containing protein [Candidatus Saccharibacteria bacterium]|nr:PEGA domain-containing protein [Candidatus Saccharibacteria bacterium]